MDWSDRGIVVGVRQHGETSVILDVLTRAHGRHTGYVHGGRSRRLRPCLQPGNAVAITWRSRIEEQLGAYGVEPLRQRAARIMASAAALHAIHHLCALVRLLAEREPHEALHDQLDDLLEAIDDAAATPAAIVRFELALLTDLGFGLGLDRCVATGRRDELAYVSPKSGGAVSLEAGAPYRDRLLALPRFLVQPEDRGVDRRHRGRISPDRIFPERDVLAPLGLTLSEARSAYVRVATGQAYSARAQITDEGSTL